MNKKIKFLKKIIKAFIPYGLIALFRYIKKLKQKQDFTWLMSEKEQNTFISLVKNAKIYLEFGAGGSTIAAIQNSNCKIYCIESSKSWMKLMRENYEIIVNSEKSGRLNFFHADIGETGFVGMPVISFDENESDFERFLNYSQKIFDEHSEIKQADMVLVDGRFRVACCLQVLLNTKEGTTIMFHDFWDRPYYHVVKKFITIIARVDSMMVCKRKEGVSNDEVRQEYENYKYNYE